MGTKQTKFGGSYSSDVTMLNSKSTNDQSSEDKNAVVEVICSHEIALNLAGNGQTDNRVTTPNNALHSFRKRFFKNFVYNINDPRSPSEQIRRTPLVFEDSSERAFTLDDTFADLFVNSNVVCSTPPVKHRSTSVVVHDEDTMPCHDPLVKLTPFLPSQQEFDPRSPTNGLIRTPIIFNDDEAGEDAMLEEILAALSFDSSDASKTELGKRQLDAKPAKKLLDRVRLSEAQRSNVQKTWSSEQRRRSNIYTKDENTIPEEVTTPKKRLMNDKNISNSAKKRAPLNCVNNRSSLRARSMELTRKSLKARLELRSCDDNANSFLTPKKNRELYGKALQCLRD